MEVTQPLPITQFSLVHLWKTLIIQLQPPLFTEVRQIYFYLFLLWLLSPTRSFSPSFFSGSASLSFLQVIPKPELWATVMSFWTLEMSLDAPANISLHGIPRPPWGKSANWRLVLVTLHEMVPFLLSNKLQTADIARERCPTTVLPSITEMAYGSWGLPVSTKTAYGLWQLPVSHWHSSVSPTVASQISCYTW